MSYLLVNDMLIGHTSAISKGDVSIAYFPEQVLSLTIGHIGRSN